MCKIFHHRNINRQLRTVLRAAGELYKLRDGTCAELHVIIYHNYICLKRHIGDDYHHLTSYNQSIMNPFMSKMSNFTGKASLINEQGVKWTSVRSFRRIQPLDGRRSKTI